MKKIVRRCAFFWAIAVLASAIISSPALCSEDDPTAAKFLGSSAPVFETVDVEGKAWNLKELIGENIIFINFWGVRCGPCVKELPLLNKFHKEYKEKGLLLLAMNVDGLGGAELKEMMSKLNLTIEYPNLTDTEFIVADAYEMMGAPLSVMIDKKGVIRYYHVGYTPEETDKEYKTMIENLIKE